MQQDRSTKTEGPTKERKLARQHTFYSTAESQHELINTLRTADQNKSQKEAERWLAEMKAEAVQEGNHPEYWDKIRIFKVTIEEVQR